jgi:hypothetical protein
MSKRLEADRFRWPKEAAVMTLAINEELAQKQNPIQIHLLLPPWLILSALQSPSLEEDPNWHKRAVDSASAAHGRCFALARINQGFEGAVQLSADVAQRRGNRTQGNAHGGFRV